MGSREPETLAEAVAAFFLRRRIKRRLAPSIAELRPARFAAVRARVLTSERDFFAPLTGRRCVYARVLRYRRELEHRTGGRYGDFSVPWKCDADEEFGGPFLVEDGAQTAHVRPEGFVRLDVRPAAPSGASAAPHIERFLERFPAARASLFDGLHGSVTYREFVVEVGQRYCFAGQVRLAPTECAEAGYRSAPTRFTFEPPEDDRLYVGA